MYNYVEICYNVNNVVYAGKYMRRIILSLSFILSFLFCINEIDALSTASTGVYELFIRTEASSTSNEVFKIPAGKTITLIKDVGISGNGCENANWFEVEYDIHTGYVCSKYLTNISWKENDDENKNDSSDIENDTMVDSDTSSDEPINIEDIYKAELEKFPESYKTKIETLHEIYPNAIFKAKKVDLSFNSFASYQYQGYGKNTLSGCPYGVNIGLSLLEDTTGARDGLKSLDSWAYDPLTDSFNTSYYGGQANRWYAPSLNTIKYYLDPRNFLSSTSVFMFEELSYAGDYYLEANIEKMLVGTFMHKTNVTGKNNTTFAKAFIDAGKTNNVNPYFLVSRVLQEIGTSRSTMVTGTWTGYNSAYYGYYNFYNIKAAGNTTTETIKNGLAYAKSMGWNNEYDALVGGAVFIAQGYIAVGQDTPYLQKFDIYGPCYGMHQYMQNIEAPVGESYKVYNGYNKAGLLNSNFVFVIPVYNDMPENTKLDDARNSNNYLRDLTINGTTIEGFNYLKEEYVINVSPLVSSVEIAATKASSKSGVIGTGTFKLTDTTQTQDVIVTAQNGVEKIYKITVTRDTNIPISIGEILNTMLINSDGTYISSIELNTKASDFVTEAKLVDGNANILIKNNKGEQKNDEVLVTGDTVTITSGEESKTFTIVIYGDINGDTKVDALDYVRIKNYIMNNGGLTDAFEIAADVNKDGKVDALDYVNVKNYIMGKYNIVQ